MSTLIYIFSSVASHHASAFSGKKVTDANSHERNGERERDKQNKRNETKQAKHKSIIPLNFPENL